ncbi:AAA family ATPase, partial [Niallia taxi]|uniref:AAA family ATPase n=1 Tax=Niallia taxi TaxID=2499688 RepID=UPI00300A2BF0
NFNIDNEEGYTIYEKIQDMFISAEVLTELVEDDLPRRSSIGISSFILFIEDLINESDLNYQQQLKIKVSDISKIEAFLTLYQKTFLFNQYMQFSWSGLSSGEQALLNVFSRFFSLSDSQSIHGNSELKKNVVVLIDEGELYFHPQWQKMLLSILIEFLPRVLSSKSVRRNLQIIITSNSPFILSDLPTANVIFLENNGENTCVKEKSSNESKTFGANIYSLYADSFFIQDGLIGEFAKQKINDLVDLFLNKDRRNELYESEEYIEKLINMVAEPVLRNKLLSLFKEKFIVNMKDKQREIFYLENRLRALKEMDTNDKN